jgi:S23 ribosomal protein.
MKYSYSFEKLLVWQLAKELTKEVYFKQKVLPKEELFGITNQVRRASVSICCNLAEGSARINLNDQNRFYEIAFGSAVETLNLLIICFELGYLNEEEFIKLRSMVESITLQINRLSSKKPQKPINPSTHQPINPKKHFVSKNHTFVAGKSFDAAPGWNHKQHRNS